MALQTADARMRMIILLLASTGCRVGALPALTLGNLTRIPEGLYKVILYEGTNNEYYTFTTREATQTGIDNYLLYRQRSGEKLSFNEKTQQWEPGEAPLIRQQFDLNDTLQARNPRPLTFNAVRIALSAHFIRCGLRTREHPTAPQSTKRIRKAISLSKGFRKRAIGIFIEAGLNHEIRELICDHATQLDQHYLRPSEKQVLEEYLKAEPYLTISDELRVKQENQTLRVERSSWEAMRKELDDIKELLK